MNNKELLNRYCWLIIKGDKGLNDKKAKEQIENRKNTLLRMIKEKNEL